jgi:hypothetical protein
MDIVLLSVVCACISFTVTESRLFMPLRDLFWVDSQHEKSKIGQLFDCGYCFGHWVSFVLVAIYRPMLFYSGFWPIDYFLTAIVIAWLSGIQWIIFHRLMEGL